MSDQSQPAEAPEEVPAVVPQGAEPQEAQQAASEPPPQTPPPTPQEVSSEDGSKNSAPSGTTPEAAAGTNLEAELKRVTAERDDFRQRLEAAEVEVARLRAAGGGDQSSGGGGGEGEEDENAKLLQDNQQLRATLRKATDLLREKVTMCVNQEKRNRALVQQVTSLKDVLAVTRDLLNIRNMEVEQLQKDVDSMEGKIEQNRRNQNHLITQMENASKINQALKTEYETQLKIFQQLKERYEEKVAALTRLNALHAEGTEVFVDAQEQIAPPQS